MDICCSGRTLVMDGCPGLLWRAQNFGWDWPGRHPLAHRNIPPSISVQTMHSIVEIDRDNYYPSSW